GARREKVLKLWEGLGYYTRANNLQRAARMIVDRHGGRFPEKYDDLVALPGIGRYTAGAVLSIAFNQPAPVLDGNVIRVLTRLFGIAENPREKKTGATLWGLAETLVRQAATLSPSQEPSPHPTLSPSDGERVAGGRVRGWFLVPTRAQKRKEAFHEPAIGARTAMSARIKSEALADKAVRPPVRRWFMVPMRDSDIVEATHRTNQSTTPPHARNVSGFHRMASAKSKLEQAWRQRVLPQKGHGIPVNLFRPQNGVGRFHCTATRATTSSSNSPTKARTGAEMPDLS